MSDHCEKHPDLILVQDDRGRAKCPECARRAGELIERVFKKASDKMWQRAAAKAKGEDT